MKLKCTDCLNESFPSRCFGLHILFFFFSSPHIFLGFDGKANIRADRTKSKISLSDISEAEQVQMKKKDQPIFKKSDGIVQQTEGEGLISKHKIRSFYLCRMHQFTEFEMAGYRNVYI